MEKEISPLLFLLFPSFLSFLRMSRSDVIPSFSSLEDAVEFWKTRCIEREKELDEANKSFDEFQEQSRALEEELEGEVEQSKARAKQLEVELSRLKLHTEDVMVRSPTCFLI